MTASDLLCSLVSAAVSDLHIRALKEHEACHDPNTGRCLFHWNASKASQVMRLCSEAQEQLGVSWYDELDAQIQKRTQLAI